MTRFPYYVCFFEKFFEKASEVIQLGTEYISLQENPTYLSCESIS